MNGPLDSPYDELMASAQTQEESLEAVQWVALIAESSHSQGGSSLEVLEDQSVLASGANPSHDVYTLEFARFVQTFRKIAVPEEFRYLFFIAGGALVGVLAALLKFMEDSWQVSIIPDMVLTAN